MQLIYKEKRDNYANSFMRNKETKSNKIELIFFTYMYNANAGKLNELKWIKWPTNSIDKFKYRSAHKMHTLPNKCK